MTSEAPRGYTISLFITRKTEETTKNKGQYNQLTIPGETKELARVELRGDKLETLLKKTKAHVDLIDPDDN